MRLVMLINADWYFLSHRLSLARQLRAEGFEVVVAAPIERGSAGEIESLGFRFVPIPMRRGSKNPLRELRAIAAIHALYRRERPDLVHHFSTKPVLYGSIAARLAGVPAVVNTIPGLGPLFDAEGADDVRLRILSRVYKGLLSGRHVRVIVQNPDDRAEVLRRGLVGEDRLSLIRGSGVNVDQWTTGVEGGGVPTAVLSSRLLWAKGLDDLAAASRLLKRDGVALRILVAGEPDPESADRVPAEQLRAWQDEGLIEWLGYRADMPDLVRTAAFAVLPSFYKEGIPKALLEAAAAGKPIVTTNMPGCREVVPDGSNGMLVPPRDPSALASAMARLVADPALRARMGARSREIAVAEFSDATVVGRTIGVYRDLLGARWPVAQMPRRSR